jgi:hypothetical protein
MKMLATIRQMYVGLLIAVSSYAQNGPYTLTIFADAGSNASSSGQQASAGSNFGHVFIELTNGPNQIYLGYYGDPHNPSRGQLRVDADLARDGDWDVKSQTYQITDEGYRAAHGMIDKWGKVTSAGSWKPWCNCGDFGETIATISGVRLPDLPKELGLNTPRSWAQYLRDHGGTVNPKRILDGVWTFVPGSTSGVDQVQLVQDGSRVRAFWIAGNRYFKAGSESASFILTGNKGTGVTHNAIIRDGTMVPFDIPTKITIQDPNTILVSGSAVDPGGHRNVVDTTLYRVTTPR